MAQLSSAGQDTKTIQALTKTPSSSSPCNNCGGKHANGKCPAYGTTCNTCSRRGHWASVCRSASSKEHQGRNPGKPSGGPSGKCRNRKCKDKKSVSEVNTEDTAELFKSLTFDHLTFDIVQRDQPDQLFVSLRIQLPHRQAVDNIPVKVDTGAQGNLLPLWTFAKIFPHSITAAGTPKPGATVPSVTTLKASGGAIIEQYRCVTVPTQYDNGWVDGPTLLGLPSMLSHKIITVNKRPDQVQDASPVSSAFHAVDQRVHFTSLDAVRKEFPDRFEGISCFKGTARLSVKEESCPAVERGRKFAIHLMPKLKTELEKMVKLKVITPVTEPTDWVSNLAYSQKANGDLQICLDPGALNKVLRRMYHRAPHLEEITHKMCGAWTFNKFDAKYIYWGIMLDHLC